MDDELYVDILLSAEDIKMLDDNFVLARHCRINGERVNLGLKLIEDPEEDDEDLEEESV